MKNFGVKSNLALDFLNGHVKSCEEKILKLKLNSEQLWDFDLHLYREYNESGGTTLLKQFDNYGQLKLQQITDYDMFGHKIGYKNYDINNNLIGFGRFYNDLVGNITVRACDGQILERYEYDKTGNIVTVKYEGSNSIDKYKYDKNNYVIKKESVREHSIYRQLNILSQPDHSKTFFVNDLAGNVKELSIFDLDKGALFFKMVCTLNNYGDETEFISYLGDGSVRSQIKYEYLYDDNGNWISQRTMTKDDKLYRKSYREIEYYS